MGTMPKTMVRDITTDAFHVHVGWTPGIADDREGVVQLATLSSTSPFRWEDVKRPESEGGDPDVGGVFDGWHVTLDREGINRLIRSLRKARDAAYGADA